MMVHDVLRHTITVSLGAISMRHIVCLYVLTGACSRLRVQGTSLVLAALRPAQLLMDMAGLSSRASSSRTQQPSVSSHFT